MPLSGASSPRLSSAARKGNVSIEPFVTSQCPYCDGKIEFPLHGIGVKMNCPHCDKLIELGSTQVPTIRLNPMQPATRERLERFDVSKNKNLMIGVLAVTAVTSACCYDVAENGSDFKAHPVTVILTSALVPIVICAAWYIKVNWNAGTKPRATQSVVSEIPQPKLSTEASWSLILGVIGIWPLPIIPSMLAIWIGYRARREIQNSNGSIRGMAAAKAGVLMGFGSIIMYALFIVLIICGLI